MFFLSKQMCQLCLVELGVENATIFIALTSNYIYLKLEVVNPVSLLTSWI